MPQYSSLKEGSHPSGSPEAPEPKEKELHHLKRQRKRHKTDQDLSKCKQHKYVNHRYSHMSIVDFAAAQFNIFLEGFWYIFREHSVSSPISL